MPSAKDHAKLTKKPIRSIAAYRRTDGTFDFVPLTGNADQSRKVTFELAPAHPSFEFGVQIGSKVVPLGIQWPNAPVRDWQALADQVAARHYAERDRKLQEEKQQRTEAKAREELLKRFGDAELNPQDEPEFSFANETEYFTTPNRLIALKLRDVLHAKFIEVVRDGDGDIWYRFSDPNGDLQDSLCPSCGAENLVPISEDGVWYRRCRTTGCGFKWTKEIPSNCPKCDHELELEITGNHVSQRCSDRINCYYRQSLGYLPHVPVNPDDARRIAVGAQGVEEDESALVAV